MGRPPSNGGPSFRFNQAEVAEMEAILQAHNIAMPSRELLASLAEKFRTVWKIVVQMKQVWNWFQNRRYAIRAKAAKSPGKLSVSPMPRDDSATLRNAPQAPQSLSAPSATVRILPQAPQHPPAPSGKSASENSQMEYEAKSARDGAWYDVATFLSHRSLETGDPEVLVRFAGFGPEEDEWVNVRKHVRQRSLPCESSECVAVLPADLILCFQEGKEQALYFDAHVLDAQRRRHDVRGCRCRFLVRYDHDQSEEIVALRKICRRPETDYRLQQLHAVNESATINQNKTGANIITGSTLRVYPPAEVTQKPHKVEPVVPAPHRNVPEAAEIKVQQPGVPVPHTDAPRATEIKVQQPVVPVPHMNAPEATVIKVQQPVVPVPHTIAAEVEVQQPVQPSPHTNSPEVTDVKVQQQPVQPSPHTDVPEVTEIKVEQPKVAEIVSADSMGNLNVLPDNAAVTSGTATSTVTGGSGNLNVPPPPEKAAVMSGTATSTVTGGSGESMQQG